MEYARTSEFKNSLIMVANAALGGGDQAESSNTKKVVAETVNDVESFFESIKRGG